MSIVSDIVAEAAEVKRAEWIAKLEGAYMAKDWGAVETLLNEMRQFYFAE